MSRNNNSRVSRYEPWKESNSFCAFLKVIVFLIGIINLGLVFLINCWQSSEPSSIGYVRTPITIEERRTFSDLINYAADFNGAEIIKTHQEQVKILGFFFKSDENPPELLLNPDNSKGKCWGFEGHKGFVQIKTKKKVYPQHFTFRHCNLINFDSAPREICVYRVEDDEDQVFLGCYEFILSKARPDPEFVQTFSCLSNCEKPGQVFKFEVSSNHGAEVTCVYQIEIHGEPAQFGF
jgi:hypothetical protein